MSKKDDVELTDEDVDRMVKKYMDSGGTVTACEKFARTEDLDIRTVWTKRKKKQHEWNYCIIIANTGSSQSIGQKNIVLVVTNHCSLDCVCIVWTKFPMTKKLTKPLFS